MKYRVYAFYNKEKGPNQYADFNSKKKAFDFVRLLRKKKVPYMVGEISYDPISIKLIDVGVFGMSPNDVEPALKWSFSRKGRDWDYNQC